MSKVAADTENLIEDKLLEAWKQEQRFFHLRGLGRFLVWLVAMVLVDFVVDFITKWQKVVDFRNPGVVDLDKDEAALHATAPLCHSRP
mgnify:CR=1 FL=1